MIKKKKKKEKREIDINLIRQQKKNGRRSRVREPLCVRKDLIVERRTISKRRSDFLSNFFSYAT